MSDEPDLEGKIVIVKFTESLHGHTRDWCLIYFIEDSKRHTIRGVDDLPLSGFCARDEFDTDEQAISILKKTFVKEVFVPLHAALDLEYEWCPEEDTSAEGIIEVEDWHQFSPFTQLDDFYTRLCSEGIVVHFV